jgi:hypothetical protein
MGWSLLWLCKKDGSRTLYASRRDTGRKHSVRRLSIRPEIGLEHLLSRPGAHRREGFCRQSTRYFFRVGTDTPGIFTLTAPRWFRLVKYRVFQSLPIASAPALAL